MSNVAEVQKIRVQGIVRLTTAIVICLLLIAPLAAQNRDTAIETDLQARLVGETLTLRGFYWGEHLVYTPDGKLASGGEPRSWTLAGKIKIERIEVQPDKLEIHAVRLFVRFDTQRGPLNVLSKSAVLLDIARDGTYADAASAAQQLATVFLSSRNHMEDLVPDFWRGCLPEQIEAGNKCSAAPAKPGGMGADGAGSDEILRAGRGGVTVPRVLDRVEPTSTLEARAVGYSCQTKLGIVVDAGGRPTQIQLERPCGMGLDEQAVDAIRRWRFSPAKLKGKPVPVSVNIEIGNK